MVPASLITCARFGSEAIDTPIVVNAVTPDHNPIIGRNPDVDGFFLAYGFSGHGLMMAPAPGKALAEIITVGASHTTDVSDFAFDRFQTGALLDDDATL